MQEDSSILRSGVEKLLTHALKQEIDILSLREPI